MVRSRRSRVTTAIAVVAALAVMAAGCGSSGKKGGGTNGPTTTIGLKGDDTGGTPVEGGALTYGIEADTSGGFCLYKAQLAIGGIQVVRSVYDTLMAPGADGKIHPMLAQSMTPNANFTKWTIKLRPGIKFHDGSALTAAVVKENLDKYRTSADNPLFVFVFADLVSVDVVDNLTVVANTKVPWSAFPWFLWGSARIGIMAHAQIASPNCNTDLIGTGPFKFKSWKFGDKFVAVKNPTYWRKDSAGRQLPYLDQITFKAQEDGPKRLTSLQSGDFQMIHTSTPQQIVGIRKDVASGKLKSLESDKYTEVGYLMLNATTCAPGGTGCTQSPFNHLSARQAFAYAVDRDLYNKVRNEGILTNASGPFAPGVDGYVADTGLPKFSPALARDAAAKYKQETGKTLTFTLSHTADPDTTKDAVFVQQQLKINAGISISLNPVPDQSTLINNAVGKKFDAVLWRNHPGADDDTQYVWWHCSNSPPQGSDPNGAASCDNIVNFGGFNDPIINKAFEDARSESDPAKRTALYESINREFAKELWNLWAQWSLWTVAFKPNIHGILGTSLPDSAKPFEGLATGHPLEGLWCDAGKC